MPLEIGVSYDFEEALQCLTIEQLESYVDIFGLYATEDPDEEDFTKWKMYRKGMQQALVAAGYGQLPSSSQLLVKQVQEEVIRRCRLEDAEVAEINLQNLDSPDQYRMQQELQNMTVLMNPLKRASGYWEFDEFLLVVASLYELTTRVDRRRYRALAKLAGTDDKEGEHLAKLFYGNVAADSKSMTVEALLRIFGGASVPLSDQDVRMLLQVQEIDYQEKLDLKRFCEIMRRSKELGPAQRLLDGD